MKNGRTGGVRSSGRFGTDAARWRRHAMVRNLLQLVEVAAPSRDIGEHAGIDPTMTGGHRVIGAVLRER